MKLKLTVFPAAIVFAMGLWLGISAAQAATVNFDPNDSTRAIGITDLNIDGTFYDVDFVGPTEAENVYGPFPGEFEFTTLGSAAAAVDAVNAALNAEGGVLYVGPEGGPNNRSAEVYDVGWSTDTVGSIPFVNNVEAFVGGGGIWAQRSTPDQSIYNADSRTWATFTAAGPPDPVDEVTIGGTVLYIAGSGLVLQNNGADDETVNNDSPNPYAVVPFTFDTPLAPGDTYDVTVKTQPSNPDQECYVARGSGTVPIEDVTNVLVVCVPFEVPEVTTAFLPAIYQLLLFTEVTPPVLVEVPDVVGQTQASAQNAIIAAGLTVGDISQQSSGSVAAGNVISQDPDGGTQVAVGSTVDLVISTGPSQGAEVIFDPNDSTRAIGITGLDIDGTLYDVDFVGPTEAVNVYGPFPGEFEFTTLGSAAAAVDAVNAALNAEGGVLYVGPEGGPNNLSAEVYDIGWSTDTVGSIQYANNVEAFVGGGGTWAQRSTPDQSIYNADSRTWATFTEVGN